MTVGTKSVENERAVTSQHWHRPAAGKDVRGGVKQLSSLLPIFPSCWAAWPLGGVLVLITAGFAWTFGILLFSSPWYRTYETSHVQEAHHCAYNLWQCRVSSRTGHTLQSFQRAQSSSAQSNAWCQLGQIKLQCLTWFLFQFHKDWRHLKFNKTKLIIWSVSYSLFIPCIGATVNRVWGEKKILFLHFLYK